MADELLEKILRLALMPKRAEQQSGADRLRPPYAGPLRGLNATTAGASRDTEVGYGRLPGPYQRALQAAPERQTQVGSFPEGYNYAGLTRSQDPETGAGPLLVGDTAQTMTHELVHELYQRRGGERDRSTEEALARLVAGNTPASVGMRGASRQAQEGAVAEDTKVRAEYPDPVPPSTWSGWLESLGRLLGR